MSDAQQLIDPENIFQVALDFMNEDHHEAVTLLNQINSAIQAQDNHQIGERLTEFYQHNCEHFAREEAQMEKFGFPPYPIHKGEHDRVLAEMLSAVEDWSKNQDTQQLCAYLTDTVIPWFEGHLQSMDYVTAQFISMQSQ